MASCWSTMRRDSIAAAPLAEQHTSGDTKCDTTTLATNGIAIPAERRKDKGRIKSLIQNLYSRVGDVINTISALDVKVPAKLCRLKNVRLVRRDDDDDDDDDYYTERTHPQKVVRRENSGNLSFRTSTLTSAASRFNDDQLDFKIIFDLSEGDHVMVAYLKGKLSRSEQRNKLLTDEIAYMQKDRAHRKRKEVEVTQQITSLKSELVYSKLDLRLQKSKEKSYGRRTNFVLTKKISELEKVLEDIQSKNECKICYSKPRDVVLYPCLHSQYCIACVKKLVDSRNVCPTCRSEIAIILPTW